MYRGKHCPLCKKYLASLNDKMQEFEEAGIKVTAVSADPREKAETEVKEEGWRFPVAYDMSLFAARPRVTALRVEVRPGKAVSDPGHQDLTPRPAPA